MNNTLTHSGSNIHTLIFLAYFASFSFWSLVSEFLWIKERMCVCVCVCGLIVSDDDDDDDGVTDITFKPWELSCLIWLCVCVCVCVCVWGGW